MTFILSFVNPGEINIQAVTTFGVNVKKSTSAIGYFGTGLKYAISVLLRNDCEITIYKGTEKFEFGIKYTSIRGKDFEIITINGEPLSFTTEVGKNWGLWQAYRELYCNMQDEEGFMTNTMVPPQEGFTTVVISGKELEEVYNERHKIALESQPLMILEGLEIHPGSSKYLYNRGIRVYMWSKPTLFTYNITRFMTLTEDRMVAYQYDAQRQIASSIAAIKAILPEDQSIIEGILTTGRSYTEGEFDYDTVSCVTPEILGIIDKIRLKPGANSSLHRVLVTHAKTLPPAPAELTVIQRKQLERAIKFCKDIGYEVDLYPIIVSDRLQGGLHGLAENETIFLSPDIFGIGTKYVASTILEEYLHLVTGYSDMTRELQNHLFNIIVSLGERVIGEPV